MLGAIFIIQVKPESPEEPVGVVKRGMQLEVKSLIRWLIALPWFFS